MIESKTDVTANVWSYYNKFLPLHAIAMERYCRRMTSVRLSVCLSVTLGGAPRRHGAPCKIQLTAARTFSGGGDFSASLSEHSNKRYNK